MAKIKRYLILLLAVTLLALLMGCEEAPASVEKETYRISLVSQDGHPLENVKIFVYEDPTLSE